MVNVVLPNHLSVIQARQNEATPSSNETQVSSNRAMQDIILNLVKKVTADPEKVGRNIYMAYNQFRYV